MNVLDLIDERPIIAHTPLPGLLGFASMAGHEQLSALFEFDVELIATTISLDLKSLLGQPLTLEIETSGAPRFLNGQIVKCVLAGRENNSSDYFVYRATVRPSMWYLTQTTDNKIFQAKTVPDVLREVLGEYGFPVEYKLLNTYRTWEYCVQYQESDFDFVSRLMEHEGIYYWFSHENGQHTLVICDDISAHADMPGYMAIPYIDGNRHLGANREYVSDWNVQAQITPDSYATVDYDFRKPRVSLDAMSRGESSGQPMGLEVYEWQGGYQEIDHGESYSRIRLEELQASREQIRGVTNVRGMAPGYLFTLKNHPRMAENRGYLIVSAHYRMSIAGYTSGTNREDSFEVVFSALPDNIPFRARRLTPVPRTHGPQTAKVVGPAGQEIWTDQYGRIKVQFHWDRYGQHNENSSSWVRVSSPWAGTGFGGLQLPRINDEVVVDFIGGNPDRPVVLGRVYNASNMPPVELPAMATQSGFRSHSVYGDPNMANMLIFEDKLGQELLHMKAQLDMLIEANRNLTVRVGNDLDTRVDNTEKHHVLSTRTVIIDGAEDETFNTGVTRNITSTGLKDTIADGVNTTVTGGNTYHLTGDNIVTVDGPETEHVTGSRNMTVDGTLSETYNSAYDQTVNSTMKRYITGTLDDTVDGAVTQTYNATKQETVSGTVTYEAGGVSTHTYKANVTEDITGQIDRNSSADMNFKSGTKITMTAPEVVIDTPKFTQTDSASSDNFFAKHMKVSGISFLFDGAKIGAVGLQTMAYGVKAEYSVVKCDFATVVKKGEGAKFKDIGAAIELGMIKTAIRGLFVAI